LALDLRINSKPKRNTESITFRLDGDVLKKLRTEAGEKDVSINTLVSQVIKQHSDWHSNAAKAGFIAVRRAFLTNLMNKVSPEELSSISKDLARKETKDFVLLLRNEYNIASALNVAECWVRISGYPFRHENSDTVHSYVIQHEMGKKMSLYLAAIYDNLFKEFGLEKVQMDISDNTISFVVDIASAETQ
jgi:hypothetical protein